MMGLNLELESTVQSRQLFSFFGLGPKSFLEFLLKLNLKNSLVCEVSFTESYPECFRQAQKVPHCSCAKLKCSVWSSTAQCHRAAPNMSKNPLCDRTP